MEILELCELSAQNIADLLHLMEVLDPAVTVSEEDLKSAVECPETRFFAAVEDRRIIGTASLCITCHPLGRKGGIEDVVVSPEARGRHIGRQLMEHIIDLATREYAPIELHLTSRPSRKEANHLYQAMGFQRYETNVYKLQLSGNQNLLTRRQ